MAKKSRKSGFGGMGNLMGLLGAALAGAGATALSGNRLIGAGAGFVVGGAKPNMKGLAGAAGGYFAPQIKSMVSGVIGGTTGSSSAAGGWQ